MPESFLRLKAQEQSQIYRAPGAQLARSPVAPEKDVRVCRALRTLFAMPDRLPMAFKGVASLSKVFGAIARFSEDVGVTLDCRGLDGAFDPFAEGVSRNRLKNFSEDLKSFARDHVCGLASPRFRRMPAEEFDAQAFRLEVSDDGERMRMRCPSAPEAPVCDVGNSVLIEFGGRNITEPNEGHEARPDIVEYVAELDFPRPTAGAPSLARA